MIDGFDGERGAVVAGSRGYFLKVSCSSAPTAAAQMFRCLRRCTQITETGVAEGRTDVLQTQERIKPMFFFLTCKFKRPDVEWFALPPPLCSGSPGVPGAGSDQLRLKDPPQQELHHALHALLHEEGGDAGGGPAQPVRRRALQGTQTFTAFILQKNVKSISVIQESQRRPLEVLP